MDFLDEGDVDSVSLLYANDDSEFANYLQTAFADISPGIEVVVADSVDNAMSRFEEETVDCVATASELPDGTGLDVLEAVHASAEDVPTILCPTEGSEMLASRATRANVSEYLPLEPTDERFTELTDRIRTLVGTSRRQHDEQTESQFWQTREHQRLAEEYDALLTNSGDAIFILDVDQTAGDVEFRFSQLSPGYETQTGLTTEEVSQRTPRDVFGEEVGAKLEANYRRCLEQREPITYREELAVAEDARIWQTNLAPVIVGGEVIRIIGIARNITEQAGHQQKLKQANRRLESLIDAVPLTIMEIDRDGEVIRWNSGAEEMFEWSRSEVVGEFNPIIPDNRQAEFADHRRRALAGEQIQNKEITRETKTGEQLDLLLSTVPITDTDEQVTSVLAVLQDITEQKHLEHRLRALHETAQRLNEAQSESEISEIALEAATEVLELEVTGIWKYDDTADALVPVGATDATDELIEQQPTFTPGSSLAWEVYESSDLRVYDNVHTQTNVYNDDTPFRSEILVPLGDYGVMSTGSTEPEVFSEMQIDLFRVLGATVTAALVRASREEQLRRQNERLDQFASVVAHDLRNPLAVARTFLDTAVTTGDPEHFEKVDSAHGRIERLIDDLLTLARGETTVEDPTQMYLQTTAREAWEHVDTGAATLIIPEDSLVVAADEGRLNRLFENLYRNAVEHAGDDVTVTVGHLEDVSGFYVADDGSGIPPEHRDEVFEHGVTADDGGTGLGLSIVSDIAQAHGWECAATESTSGGARFDFIVSRRS